MRSVIALIAVLAVIVAVVAGLFVIDPPWVARAKRFDNRRISDLQAIVAVIGESYRRDGETRHLPAALDDLGKDIRARRGSRVDPRSSKPYEYKVLTPESFRLCAEFEREGSGYFGSSMFLAREGPMLQYDPGRTCFDFTLNPDAKK